MRRKLKELEDQTREEVTENPLDHEEGKESPEEEQPSDEDICVEEGGTWDDDDEGGCVCPDGETWDNVAKKCEDDGNVLVDELVEVLQQEVEVPRSVVTLYGDALFESGKTKIKDGAEEKLNGVIGDMKKEVGDETEFKIVVVGYTDRDRIISGSNLCRRDRICTNDALGSARANSVVRYIKGKWTELTDNNIEARSAGDTCATKIKPTRDQKALDRKVRFWVFFGDENTTLDEETLCKKPEDEQ